jgi:hypothetical protein
VLIHSAAAALRPHVSWAVGAALGAPDHLEWTPQPAERGAWRAEQEWRAPAGFAARLATVLQRFPDLRFEVTEEPTALTAGLRFSFTPRLGLFQAMAAPSGDIVVDENRLHEALRRCESRPHELAAAIRRLLGQPWDDELEPYRYAGQTRWLRVV